MPLLHICQEYILFVTSSQLPLSTPLLLDILFQIFSFRKTPIFWAFSSLHLSINYYPSIRCHALDPFILRLSEDSAITNRILFPQRIWKFSEIIIFKDILSPPHFELDSFILEFDLIVWFELNIQSHSVNSTILNLKKTTENFAICTTNQPIHQLHLWEGSYLHQD